MQRNYSTFFNPVGLWLMNLLYFVTVTHFSVCLISVFEYILFTWVNIAWKIYYHAKKNVFSGDSNLSFSDSHFFFSKLFLSKSVIPCLSWMSCDVNSTLWTSCRGLWISRLATSWPSWFTLRGHSCCVFDCYPKSSGLRPSVTDWYRARSPASKRPLV